MANSVSSDILEKWLNAWSLSRELPLPTKFKSGYKVDVGYEKQKARYVFRELNNDFIKLSETINETWVFLKVCASPKEIKNKLSEKWVIQPQGYMMSCISPMNIPNKRLPDGYEIEFDGYNSTTVVKIVTKDGELACIGRLVIVDDLAVYDRISTEENHKRKGLATFLIKELERIALSKNVHRNFLVATEQGKLLYQSLGWKICSLYTSVVIPF
ncbi:GNAT family N-acetyltransferase [Sphingobacterium detergens]|uniref:Acetyltransferase (GNAT) family protein n=1 Tax=Sphingobacterium detergens TaxID=1145106 RepID=A0A420ARK3_SPHD1|nr:GNAT family N-acetyltransferase [Sphingobacterium detergens]RKE47096.1 acetyltransferase (GNAT) family protein [Sphingobacterium detergens]